MGKYAEQARLLVPDLGAYFVSLASTPVRYGARVYNDANISVGTGGSGTALTFNQERYDTAGVHSTSSNTSRLTFPFEGIWLVIGNMRWAANTTGQRAAQIRLNGTTIIGSLYVNASAADPLDLCVSTMYAFSATDYVELIAYQNSGGAINVLAAGNYSPEFMCHRLA